MLACPLLSGHRSPPAAAQAGGFPVQTTTRTQFVMQNGEVVRREGSQTTPLTQNVKLRERRQNQLQKWHCGDARR